MLEASPGHNATVLLALAWTGGTPVNNMMGKDTKLPPPATAFSVPAITPAKKRTMACLRCKRSRVDHLTGGAAPALD